MKRIRRRGRGEGGSEWGEEKESSGGGGGGGHFLVER